VPSFPFGSAVCEVEVDPETGAVETVRYTSVDDVGRTVNPPRGDVKRPSSG
jgi:carbon-monoxide dehydrogenase large subunit